MIKLDLSMGTEDKDDPEMTEAGELLHNFLATTSVKVIPKIVKSPTLCLRRLWLFGFLFGTGVAVYFSWFLLSRYLMRDIVMMINETLSIDDDFPSITICGLNPIANLNISNDQLIDFAVYGVNESEAGQTKPHLTPDLLFEYFVTIRNLTEENLLPFVVECVWNALDDSDGGLINHNCTDMKKHIFESVYGYCFTITAPVKRVVGVNILVHVDNSKEYLMPIYELGIYSVPITNAILMMIHKPGTLPNPEHSIPVQCGNLNTVKFQHSTHVKLESHSTCVKSPEYALQNHSVDIGYDKLTCEHLCKQEHIIYECGCVDGRRLMSVEELRGTKPYCGMLDPKNVGLADKTRICLESIGSQFSTDCHGSCEEPCTDDRYEVTVDSISWPHPASQIAFYKQFLMNHPYFGTMFTEYEAIMQTLATNFTGGYKLLVDQTAIKNSFTQMIVIPSTTTVKKFTDKEAIPIAYLMGSMGGTLNLWVGLTFVTFIELFELLYRLCQIYSGFGHKQDVVEPAPEVKETTLVTAFQPPVEGTDDSTTQRRTT